jgi:hypothetical protein
MTLLQSGRHATAGWAARSQYSVIQLQAAHLHRFLHHLERRSIRVSYRSGSRNVAPTVASAYQDSTAEDIRTAATPRVATFRGLSGDDFRSRNAMLHETRVQSLQYDLHALVPCSHMELAWYAAVSDASGYAAHRHPLDQQNTRLLRLLPGLEGLIKGLIGGAGETILLLENMGSSILVGPEQVGPGFMLMDVHGVRCCVREHAA